MSRFIPIVSIFSGIIILVTVGWVGYDLLQEHSQTNQVDSQPVIFYQRAEIARFDQAGNPMGKPELWRKIGLHGRPQRIFAFSQEVYVGATQFHMKSDQIVLQYEQGVEGSRQQLFEKTLDYNGRELSTRDVIPEISPFVADSLVSPDKRYSVSSSIICNTPDFEGPCNDDIQLEVTDTVLGSTRRLRGTDLEVSTPAGKDIRLLGFSPTSDRFYFLVSNQQEAGYQALVRIELGTAQVKKILENNGQAGNPDWIIDVLDSARGRTGHVVIFKSVLSSTGEVLRFSLSDEQFTRLSIVDQVPVILHLMPTEEGAAIDRDYNKGSEYLDFRSGKKSALMSAGQFIDWSADGRFFAWEQYGIDGHPAPHSVSVQNRMTGEVELVFQQLGQTMQAVSPVNSAPTGPAKVGDELFSWVGLK